MCGPAGSGKSTYARRLEREGMVRLSIDVELWRRGAATAPIPRRLHDEVEAELRARLLDLVAAGADDVVLTADLAARYFDQFEPPTPEEGPLTVVRQ